MLQALVAVKLRGGSGGGDTDTAPAAAPAPGWRYGIAYCPPGVVHGARQGGGKGVRVAAVTSALAPAQCRAPAPADVPAAAAAGHGKAAGRGAPGAVAAKGTAGFAADGPTAAAGAAAGSGSWLQAGVEAALQLKEFCAGGRGHWSSHVKVGAGAVVGAGKGNKVAANPMPGIHTAGWVIAGVR